MRYKCPECNSEDLYITEKIIYELNTGNHFHDLVAIHDAAAEVYCDDCSWKGYRYDVKED